MPSILFVCTANQFRSPIAAAIFRKKLQEENPREKWEVASAGTWTVPGLPINPFSYEVAKRLGVVLVETTTFQVNASSLSKYDLILVMEAGQKEAIRSEFPSVKSHVYLISEVVDNVAYDIPDPAKLKVDPDEVARQLKDTIERGYEKICQLAETLQATA